MVPLGKKALSKAQTFEGTWLKLGQVCIAASFDTAGNDNNQKEASKNHTFTKTQDILDMLVNIISTTMAEGTSCSKAVFQNMDGC